jgi:DNA-binding transcriptional regulator PaaX
MAQWKFHVPNYSHSPADKRTIFSRRRHNVNAHILPNYLNKDLFFFSKLLHTQNFNTMYNEFLYRCSHLTNSHDRHVITNDRYVVSTNTTVIHNFREIVH